MWSSVCFDWVQFCGRASSPLPVENCSYPTLKVCRNEGHTRVFQIVCAVYEKARFCSSHRDELLFTMCHTPFSAILAQNLCQLKVENRRLYEFGFVNRVAKACKELGVEFNNFTRLDISVDFYEFANKMTPPTFIDLFLKRKLVKKGSRQFNLWGNAAHSACELRNFKGNWNADKHEYYCISFGKPQSDVHVKLYNKSKEIREQCNIEGSKKFYIKRYWKANGLKSNADVWRLEFSITRRSMTLVETDTGVIRNIGFAFMDNQMLLVDLIACSINKFFKWYDLRNASCKKECKELHLFDNLHASRFDYLSVPAEQSLPSRSTKMVMNYLYNYAHSHDLSKTTCCGGYALACLDAVFDMLGVKYRLERKHIDKYRDTPDERIQELKKEMEWASKWLVWNDEKEEITSNDLAFTEKLRSEKENVENFLKWYKIKFLQSADN